jgi:hypothetical protein
MSLFSPLAPYRLLIELGVVVVASGVLYGMWVHHDHVMIKQGQDQIIAADKAATDKQAKIDAVVIKTSEDKHAQEIDALKTAYLTPIDLGRKLMCFSTPNRVPEAPVLINTGPAPVVVQPDMGVHPDLSAAIKLLLKRADGLSADARELVSETH